MKRLWSKKIKNDVFEERLSRLDGINGVIGEKVKVTVPKTWSVLASDILAQKYLRMKNESQREADIREVSSRMAQTWAFWAKKYKYFDEQEALIFIDEICYSLVEQMSAPNSPQWFNTGLFHAYGITGEPLGHWYIDDRGQAKESENSYERPQAHACFIQSVKSDLVRAGGLMDLWAREARLFKLGSGTGTNFSLVPSAGEPLPGGGFASGVMGFLKVGDASAAAIRSGGITRRAAKMVILDIDHPDIEDFITWKMEEERKVVALIRGSHELARDVEKSMSGDHSIDENLPAPLIDELNWRKKRGDRNFPLTTFDGDFNGSAYASVSGQNSNNSIRISKKFFSSLEKKQQWSMYRRLDGKESKKIAAELLWQKICHAAWACADPGLQFSDTINFWNTCENDGEIIASNPCSEYLFLEDTGCNLASINLLKFYDVENNKFDLESFVHACKMWTTVLDISVSMAQYPSRTIAERSYRYRTLGLGFANLGGLLMAAGIPYDSEAGRAIAAAISSLMSASAYETSCELAQKLGAFPAFENNRISMLRVIDQHAKVSRGEELGFEGVTFPSLKKASLPQNFASLYDKANELWSRVQSLAATHGVRNAQVTAIAPTGTIGLLMDCDTTGIEPDYALVKNKKMITGESKTIVNKVFEFGLKNLGYDQVSIEKLKQHVMSNGELYQAKELKPEHAIVFQTSLGTNPISPMAHLLMVASCGPYISGGISKTINLPRTASPEDVSELYLKAHKLGVKSISLYRDGCKLSQPLKAMAGVLLPCPKCGKSALVAAGTCHKCENCGETTSCS